LTGAWGGTLRQQSHPEIDYRVTLVIAQCANDALDGFLYYEASVTNVNGHSVIFRGVDQLGDGAHTLIDYTKGTWTPQFQRKAHEWIGHTATYQTHPPRYRWHCEIKDWGRTAPSMSVKIKSLNQDELPEWEGDLYKR
jgi:hypothetical protein